MADGVIAPDQAAEIEARARATMVRLAVNSLLCLGILAATGGFIVWLGTPASVATLGLVALGLGAAILRFGSALFDMFGNAAALIGAGLLIGGASIELIESYSDIAGPVMAVAGLAVAAALTWLYTAHLHQAPFVTGAILLMGVAMHLVGIGYLISQADLTGLPVALFYLYAATLLAGAGWLIDIRLVTALAIVPFAQALDTGTIYFHAAYVFYSPESTLSILQMTALIAACLWIAVHRPDRTARHARVLAVLAFIVANLCALVGSLWGDVVGETVWGPRADFGRADMDWEQWRAAMDWEQWRAAMDAFRSTALVLSEGLYSVLWAVALVAIVAWAAHTAQRGLFNTAMTFGGIHAYTQFFESYFDEPLAYVIGGLAAIPLAWGLWRLDRWIATRHMRRVTDPAA